MSTAKWHLVPPVRGIGGRQNLRRSRLHESIQVWFIGPILDLDSFISSRTGRSETCWSCSMHTSLRFAALTVKSGMSRIWSSRYVGARQHALLSTQGKRGRLWTGRVTENIEKSGGVGSPKWIKCALELHAHLLTATYLCGGAPGRVTELQSLLFRNTATSHRNIHFNGAEVVLAPGYTKQRNSRGGVIMPVLRYHLDSAMHLKRFCVFIRPILERVISKTSTLPCR